MFQGHYRRGVVMAALGQHEEAFVSFALCVALDHNGETMRNELTGVSYQILTWNTLMVKRKLCNEICIVRENTNSVFQVNYYTKFPTTTRHFTRFLFKDDRGMDNNLITFFSFEGLQICKVLFYLLTKSRLFSFLSFVWHLDIETYDF